MNRYKAGQSVKVSTKVSNPDTGAPVDVSALTLTWGVLPNLPNQQKVSTVLTLAQGQITHDGTGQYHAVIDTTGLVPAGVQFVVVAYEWVATGGVAGADDARFEVEALPW